MKVLTSINPGLVRYSNGLDVSVDYQRACISAWRAAGFEVVSLNCTSEIDQLKERYADVSTIKIIGRRAKIADFISTASELGEPVVGIANSDCLFMGDEKTAEAAEDVAAGGMLLFERLNFDPDSFASAFSCWGFDAFFFNTQPLAQMKMSANLKIGDSWWDYIFDLSYRQAGGSLFQTSPMLLHLNHPIAWSEENYRSGALLTSSMFASEFGTAMKDDESTSLYEQFAIRVYRHIGEASKQVSLRGSDVGAQMADHLAKNLRKSVDEAQFAEPLDLDRHRLEGEERYRASHVPSKGLGEFFCSMAALLQKMGISKDLSRALFRLGEDMQFSHAVKTRLGLSPEDQPTLEVHESTRSGG